MTRKRKRTFVAPFVLTVACSSGAASHVEPKPSAPLERYEPPPETIIDAAPPEDEDPTAGLPRCGDPGVFCNPPPPPDAGPPTPAIRPPLHAKVIGYEVSSTGTVIRLSLGQRDGVERGMRGHLVDRDDKPLQGGDFIILGARDATSVGRVRLTPEQVAANPRARLFHPPY
jgi:hypothetical protein